MNIRSIGMIALASVLPACTMHPASDEAAASVTVDSAFDAFAHAENDDRVTDHRRWDYCDTHCRYRRDFYVRMMLARDARQDSRDRSATLEAALRQALERDAAAGPASPDTSGGLGLTDSQRAGPR
ncbi:MAG: hypothetical protein AAFX58_06235 [Pseudomonadota bacterium]